MALIRRVTGFNTGVNTIFNQMTFCAIRTASRSIHCAKTAALNIGSLIDIGAKKANQNKRQGMLISAASDNSRSAPDILMRGPEQKACAQLVANHCCMPQDSGSAMRVVVLHRIAARIRSRASSSRSYTSTASVRLKCPDRYARRH